MNIKWTTRRNDHLVPAEGGTNPFAREEEFRYSVNDKERGLEKISPRKYFKVVGKHHIAL